MSDPDQIAALAAAGHIEFVDPAYVAPPEPAAAPAWTDCSALVAFVAARADEREVLALAATPGEWAALDGGVVSIDDDDQWPVSETASTRDRQDRLHIAANGPARVLREVAATRHIIELHGGAHECSVYSHGGVDNGAWCAWPEDCSTLLALAAIDSGHPDYDQAWAVAGLETGTS